MKSWNPISKQELQTLIEVQLKDCSHELKKFYETYKVPLSRYPIERNNLKEQVFVVAIKGNEVMYYEDVEEGWNFSLLPKGKGLLELRFEQDELKHALYKWKINDS